MEPAIAPLLPSALAIPDPPQYYHGLIHVLRQPRLTDRTASTAVIPRVSVPDILQRQPISQGQVFHLPDDFVYRSEFMPFKMSLKPEQGQF